MKTLMLTNEQFVMLTNMLKEGMLTGFETEAELMALRAAVDLEEGSGWVSNAMDHLAMVVREEFEDVDGSLFLISKAKTMVTVKDRGGQHAQKRADLTGIVRLALRLTHLLEAK